ncbi:hypothetical protein ACO0SA_000667 [Hanseniaspora valbyensis]
MIFLLFTIPIVTSLAYVVSDRFLYLNINKLTTNDPAVSITNNTSHKLKTFNKLYILSDKKWNYKLKLLFNSTIILYFNVITIIIYEIIQYEHIDENSSKNRMDKEERIQQYFLITYCIPLMMQLLSILLSFVFPFIIITLGLKKFNLTQQKNLIITSTALTAIAYQLIINNIINLHNEEASILLKLALLGLIFMSSLSAIGCVVTTYYHYFLSKNKGNYPEGKKKYSPIKLIKKIIETPNDTILYSCLMDLIFLYYCNFKNLLTIFIKIPKNLVNLDIIYGLDKITKDKNSNKESSNPIVVTIVNIINLFYYSQDEKVDQVLMVKVISILLSFSLFLLCFNYILSFLRNGLNILMYYFDIHQENIISDKPAVKISPVITNNQELPIFNSNVGTNSRANLPSHIKNFIFLEFLGIYILATILVILKLFLTKEFEEYLSRYVLNNWMSINVQKSQSTVINTDTENEKSFFLIECMKWIVNVKQFPLLNKLVIINFKDNESILDNVQVLFDMSFEITWGILIIAILAFEISRIKHSDSTEHLFINSVINSYKNIKRKIIH